MSSATQTIIGTGRHAIVIKPGVQCGDGTPIPGTISKIYSPALAKKELSGSALIGEVDPHGMATIPHPQLSYCETLPETLATEYDPTVNTIITMPDAGTPLIEKNPDIPELPKFISMSPYFPDRRRGSAPKETVYHHLHFASRELFRISFILCSLNHHGIYHHDIHPGNILAKDTGKSEDGYRLTIIDYEDTVKTDAKEDIGDAQVFISQMNQHLESVFGAGIAYNADDKLWELHDILNRTRVNPGTGLPELHKFSAKFGAKEEIGDFMGELLSVGTDDEPDPEQIRYYTDLYAELTS